MEQSTTYTSCKVAGKLVRDRLQVLINAWIGSKWHGSGRDKLLHW